jgi:hypothetical protein
MDTGPTKDKKMRMIATLRDGSPLMVDAPILNGRVVVMLTSLDPRWTNWPQDPTFVVMALKLVGYLGSFRLQETSGRVGQPIAMNYSSREALPNLDILLPSVPGSNSRLQLSLNATDDGQQGWTTTIGHDLNGQTEDFIRTMLQPGVVEVWRTQLQGQRQVRNFARNPSPSEGDLTRSTSTELVQSLRPVEVRYRNADSLGAGSLAAGLANRNTLLMCLLLGFLLFEQFLAWRASYHMPLRAGGGA